MEKSRQILELTSRCWVTSRWSIDEERESGVRERRVVVRERVVVMPRLDDKDASQVVQHPRVSTFPLKLIALIICRVSRPSYLFTECVVSQCVYRTTYTHCLCLEDSGSGEKGAYLVFHRHSLTVVPFDSTFLYLFHNVFPQLCATCFCTISQVHIWMWQFLNKTAWSFYWGDRLNIPHWKHKGLLAWRVHNYSQRTTIVIYITVCLFHCCLQNRYSDVDGPNYD